MAKSGPAVRGRPRRPAPGSTPPTGPDRLLRELTRVFKSLADEQRLKILFLLAERGELNVSTIGEELDQSQPAVSHHLTQLKAAGLIDFRREGKFNFYALNPTGIVDLLAVAFPDGPAKVSFGGVEASFKAKK